MSARPEVVTDMQALQESALAQHQAQLEEPPPVACDRCENTFVE